MSTASIVVPHGPGKLADPTLPPETWSGRKAKQWTELTLNTYGRVCYLCGLPGANSADHVIPRSRGGAVYDLTNLGPSHRSCNYARGNRDHSGPRPVIEDGQAWFSRTIVPAPAAERLVVVLFGPPGAGKSTAARESGLRVYDRDDPQWVTDRHFGAALDALASDPDARAVVIRHGASSTARARVAAQVGATHAFLLDAADDELARRIRSRGRSDIRGTMAGIQHWRRDHDHHDAVEPFPGWRGVLTAT